MIITDQGVEDVKYNEIFLGIPIRSLFERCDVVTEFGSVIGVAAEGGRRAAQSRDGHSVKTRVYMRNEKKCRQVEKKPLPRNGTYAKLYKFVFR